MRPHYSYSLIQSIVKNVQRTEVIRVGTLTRLRGIGVKDKDPKKGEKKKKEKIKTGFVTRIFKGLQTASLIPCQTFCIPAPPQFTEEHLVHQPRRHIALAY